MSVRPCHLLRVVAMAAFAIGAPRALTGQWLRIHQGGGELGVEARDERMLGGVQRGASSRQFSQWFVLPLSGVIFSPQLLSYSVSIRPTWVQQTVFGQPGPFNTHSIGLGGAANILPGALVSLSLHTDKNSASTEGGLGSRTQYESRTGGGILRLRSSAFPIFADWNVRTTNDLWQASADQSPVRRDETLRTLRITGQSSKLTATLERLSFEDRVGALGFSSLGGSVLHALHWGKGSSIQSVFETLNREGNNAQRRQSNSERLHLQHTTTVATEYSLDRQRTTIASNEFKALAGSAGIRFQPRPWVGGGLRTSSSSSTFTTGSIGSVAVVPSVRLEGKLPGGARLAGSVSAGYERISQQLPSDSWIQVADEPHTVDQSRVFVLAHERGDVTTIRLYNPEHTIAYLSGIDYRVTVLGDLVRIDVPIASRLAVGDAVVVSYRYAAPTAGEHELRSGDATASFTIGGFSLTSSASLRRGRSLSGNSTDQIGNLDDRLGSGDDYVLAAAFHRATGIGRVDLDVQRRSREHSRSDFVLTELRAGYAPPSSLSLQSSFGASIARTATVDQAVRVVTVNATVNWNPTATTHISASLESMLWYPQQARAEETYIGNLELGWAVGGIEAEVRYVYQRRVGTMSFDQQRLFGRFKRRF